MPKPAPPDTPLSQRATRLAQRRERRVAKAVRREGMFGLVIAGFDHVEIAKNFHISVATVRREVDRAVDSRRLEAPERYILLQVERLTKALKTVDILLENGSLAAAEPWLKIMDRLDRYHIGAVARAPVAEAPPRLSAHPAPLALTQAVRDLAEGG